MGRGDRKTRKGKIAIRSYGNARPHAEKSTAGVATTVVKPASKPAVKKVAPAKKAPAKKTA